jgi:hypothetical protein
MKNRFTTRYIVIAALFITILAPMTRVHANGALDNTFGNNDPKNGIYTLAGSVSDGAIFYDLAAQGNKSIIVGAKENDLIVVRLDSSGELDPTFGTAGSFLYDTS